MDFKWQWHEKLVRRITERNLGMAILGGVSIAFSLGGIFSIQLVKYGYFILIASTMIFVGYLNTSFTSWLKNENVEYISNVIGFIGGFLLVIFLGIQSPHIPFKIYILMAGFILAIPALINVLGRERK